MNAKSNFDYPRDFPEDKKDPYAIQYNPSPEKKDIQEFDSKIPQHYNIPAIEIKDDKKIERQQSPPLKKKNRTLQFYKFLFYSMKVEIKVHEFFDIVRFSNQSEISLWILSLVLYANTPKDFPMPDPNDPDHQAAASYKNVFIWIHLIHIVRGLIGMLLMIKMPRSFQVVEAMKAVPEADIETKLFNDIARGVIDKEVVKPISAKRIWLIIYFILTFVNFVFDVIDFLVILSSLDKAQNNEKVVLLTYLMIAFLYIAIDLSYLFWTASLKYTFPPAYLSPISDAFTGVVSRVLSRFKIRKPLTDIKNEAAVQGENKPEVNPDNISIEMPGVQEPNVIPQQEKPVVEEKLDKFNS